MEKLLTASEVAVILGRPTKFVQGLIRDGKLPVVRLGDEPLNPRRRGRKDHRIAPADVEAFIEARRVRLDWKPVPKVEKKPKPVPIARLTGWDAIDRMALKNRKRTTTGQ